MADIERLELPCKFGTLVCEIARDDEAYKEFAIDLHRNDGKIVQVCVVGTDKLHDKYGNERSVHIYMYDGDDQDVARSFYTNPFGDGWYGEE